MKFNLLILILTIGFCGCETSIEPISNTGKEYSVYGTLDMQKPPNHIRVYDTKKLLTPESTEKLDVEVHFTDLEKMQREILEDQVVKFDNIYTHNYKVENPLPFDNSFKVEWIDSKGFSDSLIFVTPKESELTILENYKECGEAFLIQLTNINFEAGEQLLSEVAVQLNGKWYWAGISRKSIYEYSQADLTLILGWSPSTLLGYIFGITSGVSCSDLSSNIIKYRFTHVGYMEGDYTPSENFSDSTGVFMNKQVVLPKYSGETEITFIPDQE